MRESPLEHFNRECVDYHIKNHAERCVNRLDSMDTKAEAILPGKTQSFNT